MENTSLWQEVERVVKNEALARIRLAEERKNAFPERPPVRKVSKSLYGFEIIEEEAVDFRPQLEKIDFEIGNYKKITQSQVDFAEELHKSSISLIAVLPVSLWQGICKKFGLYRFENIDEAGGANIAALSKSKLETAQTLVGCSFVAAILGCIGLLLGAPWYIFGLFFAYNVAECSALYESIEKKRLVRASCYWLSTLALSSVSIFATFGDQLESLSAVGLVANLIGYGFVLGFASFIVLSIVFCNGEEIIERLVRMVGTKVYDAYFRALSHKKLLKALWPDGVDALADANKIKVHFPDPPLGVFELLKKLKSGGFRPMVAAVPDAITLDIVEVKENMKEQIKKMNLDPIIYVKKDDDVAILCQFGDFAPEEEVIKWVKKEGVRLCFN